MSNSRTRAINYTPRMSQLEAFDLCDAAVRGALASAVAEFDTCAVLRYQRQHGVAATLRWISSGNRSEAARPWIPARGVKGTPGYRPAMPNPCVVLGLRPL